MTEEKKSTPKTEEQLAAEKLAAAGACNLKQARRVARRFAKEIMAAKNAAEVKEVYRKHTAAPAAKPNT